MPAIDKTPAPSRRFLPPSSSASSKQWASSGRRAPFAHSQSSFTPSSTSYVPHNLRFETPARADTEDIDISFGDANSSPLDSRRVTQYPTSDSDQIDENEFASLQDLTKLPKRRSMSIEASPQSPVSDTVDRPSPETGGYYNPRTPSRKRRKLSESLKLESRDAVHISSSSEVEHGPLDDQQSARDEEDIRSYYGGQPESPELVTPPIPTRFKTPLTEKDTRQTTQQRPSFRPFVKDNRLNAMAEQALPDAFSPSRRKGKKTYVPGGLADTVRNWVLNVASEELQLKRAEEVIDPSRVNLDSSGRAIVASDDAGDRWILVGDQAGGDAAGSISTASRLRNGAKLTIRGTSTKWKIPAVGAHAKQETHIAAHWDVS